MAFNCQKSGVKWGKKPKITRKSCWDDIGHWCHPWRFVEILWNWHYNFSINKPKIIQKIECGYSKSKFDSWNYSASHWFTTRPVRQNQGNIHKRTFVTIHLKLDNNTFVSFALFILLTFLFSHSCFLFFCHIILQYITIHDYCVAIMVSLGTI